jgi:hypothetical protein
MHRPLFRMTAGGVAACGALIIASALPAGAATSTRAETMALSQNGPGPSEDTPVTFTVSSTGTLDVTVPAGPVSLGTGAVNTIIGPTSLGPVTVIDLRATNPSDWTATVSSTDFTSTPVVGGPTDTIDAADATYLIPSVNADTPGDGGVGSDLPLAAGIDNIASTGVPLSGIPDAVAAETGADGDNAATWNPTIAIAVPALAVQGVYTGTITHSFT